MSAYRGWGKWKITADLLLFLKERYAAKRCDVFLSFTRIYENAFKTRSEISLYSNKLSKQITKFYKFVTDHFDNF